MKIGFLGKNDIYFLGLQASFPNWEFKKVKNFQESEEFSILLIDDDGLDLMVSFPSNSLILTNRIDFSLASKLLAKGVKGCLSKSSNLDIVRSAILTVASGAIYLDPLFNQHLYAIFETWNKEKESLQSWLPIFDSLEPDEREYLQLLNEGFSEQKISEHLQVPYDNLHYIGKKLRRKFNLRRTHQIASLFDKIQKFNSQECS